MNPQHLTIDELLRIEPKTELEKALLSKLLEIILEKIEKHVQKKEAFEKENDDLGNELDKLKEIVSKAK